MIFSLALNVLSLHLQDKVTSVFWHQILLSCLRYTVQTVKRSKKLNEKEALISVEDGDAKLFFFLKR